MPEVNLLDSTHVRVADGDTNEVKRMEVKTLQRSKLLGAQVGGSGGVDSETKFNKLIKTLNSEFTYGIVILKDIAPPSFNNFCDL